MSGSAGLRSWCSLRVSRATWSHRRGDVQTDSGQDWSVEGSFGATWTYFKLHTPRSRIATNIEYLPSITQSGRNRLNFDINLRQEFLKDMFWALEFWSTLR